MTPNEPQRLAERTPRRTRTAPDEQGKTNENLIYNGSYLLPYHMNIDLIREAFGEAEFGPREASVILGTSIATTRTLLKEMRTKGHLIRTGRGRYKVARLTNTLALARQRAQLRLEHALDTPLEVGLDGPDAIDHWTRGRYTIQTEPNAIHIAVVAKDEAAYRDHLQKAELPVGEGHRKPHVILRVVPDPCFTLLDGVPVLDREAVMELIQKNPIAYEGADQWLATT